MSHVRAFKEEDADAVAAIMNESVEARDSTMRMDRLSRASVLAEVAGYGKRECLLVVEDDGQVVGWGRIHRYSEREGYRYAGETSVFLRRDAVGRGLGTLVQQALLRRAAEDGYHHLVAKIFADNKRSIRMHQKLGYEMVGVQREIGNVDGVWKDVAIMQYIFATERFNGHKPPE